jgi:3-hydroxyisobutyrate dehydrogenase-like beta-hydroxyacid dehydrogenase
VTTVTVVGLGEAGKLYATGLLASGAVVRGYDPYVTISDGSVAQFDDIVTAVDAADLVISLVGATASTSVADAVIPYLGGSTVYADFNTASPAVKASLARQAAEAGIRFADVAVLAPVNRGGSTTALMTSGTGAERTAELLRPFEVPIEVIPGEAGMAASRKLLRSVFMKGLAGLVLETVAAGAAAGNESWIRDQMAAELGPDGDALVERLFTGSHAHAARRTHEIEDALDYVRHLGTPAWMTEGALKWLSSLAEGRG